MRGRNFRIGDRTGFTRGMDNMYPGERCSIVTCEALRARAGTSETAVAPLPMTTIFLPA